MIFMRHPTPLIDKGICYGRLDLELHPDSEAQIAKGVSAIPPVSAVRASPAKRCRKLAQTIAKRHKAALIWDERLIELNFGAWEGIAWSVLERNAVEHWLSDPWTIAPPDGETFSSLYSRVQAAIKESDNYMVLVCHASPIRAAMMQIQKKTFQQAFAEPIPYAIPIKL